MHIKKNDTVKIISGKDRGKIGKVIRVIPKDNKIVVEGTHVYAKHVRPKRANEQGQTVKVARPFDASNAMVVCASCKKPTRVGCRTDGEKIRYCRKCKAPIR